VEKDEALALGYYRRAAEADHVEAQYVLGRYYEKSGEPDQARLWMARAAAAGHRRAESWEPRVAESRASLPDLIRSERLPPDRISATEAKLADGSGRTPLMVAVEEGSAAWVNALLAAGADLDGADRHGVTALHRAVIGGHADLVRSLLRSGADPDVTDAQKDAPLHLAVSVGSEQIAAMLIGAGADRKAENATGWSAGDLARRSEDPKMLAAFGINGQRRVAGSSGFDDPEVLHRRLADAAVRGNLAVIDDLLGRPHYDPEWPGLAGVLMKLADGGSAAALARLVDSGVPFDERDERGRTALHAASASGSADCVALLVKHGAELDSPDGLGRTPLLLASRAGSGAAVGLLLGAGAAADQTDQNGRNALWWALKSAHGELAMQLLEFGVPALADNEGMGPLHLAAAADLPDVVERLLPSLQVDEPTQDGNSALLLAARAGALDAAGVLVENGAAVGYRNPLGDTALIIAARSDRLEVARLLLEAGANQNSRNERFESAASIVAERKDPQWLSLLAEHRRGVLDLLGAR
jgi:cytohesin